MIQLTAWTDAFGFDPRVSANTNTNMFALLMGFMSLINLPFAELLLSDMPEDRIRKKVIAGIAICSFAILVPTGIAVLVIESFYPAAASTNWFNFMCSIANVVSVFSLILTMLAPIIALALPDYVETIHIDLTPKHKDITIDKGYDYEEIKRRVLPQFRRKKHI